MDLISGLPLDTPENYEKGLVKVLSLQPEHLSVYSLIIAENTPFYALYGPGGSLVCELPDEDAERTMYARTGEILKDAGYHRYEISNYALPGRECRHNTGYWSHVPYLGFGAAAASFVPLWGEDVMLRYRNVSSHDYLGKPYEEQETLTEEELRREYMMLRLRMTEGVSDADFRARFGISLFDAFPDEIRKTVREGLLAYRADPAETEKAEAAGVFLTPKGLDLANLVFEEFL